MNSGISGDHIKCAEEQEVEQGRAVVLKANRRIRVPSEHSSWCGHWKINGMRIKTSKYSTEGRSNACRQPLQMSGKRVPLKSYKSKRDKRRSISSLEIERRQLEDALVQEENSREKEATYGELPRKRG